MKSEIDIIKKLTGVNDGSIKASNDGLMSRGYVIDNGRIVFKFPRDNHVSFRNEIAILSYVNGLNLDINLQKVQWTSGDDSYLGVYGVEGKSLEDTILSQGQKVAVGEQLGRFLAKLHQATPSNISKLSLMKEIESWQGRYHAVQAFIRQAFSSKERERIEVFMMDTMPNRLSGFGERLVFSHADLGDGNIFIDKNGKVGIIDFNGSGYFEEAADFMDITDGELCEITLDEYGANRILREKVKIRRLVRPIIVLEPYLRRNDQVAIDNLTQKIKTAIKRF